MIQRHSYDAISTENGRAAGNEYDVEASKEGAEIDIFGILNRRKGLIVTSAIVGLMLGAAYYLFLPPSYESKTQILLMQNASASMASEKGDSTQDSISDDLLATHMSMLQSRRIISEALKNAKLDELPSLVERIEDDGTPIPYIIDNLYVTRGGSGTAKGARVLSLAFRHSNAEDSQSVVKAILNEYKAFVSSKFQDINKEAYNLINKARLEMETDIDELSKNYRDFRSTSPILASEPGRGNVYSIRYEELSSELSILLSAIDEATGRLELVKSQLKLLEGTNAHQLEKLALIDDRNAQRLGVLVTVERGEAQTASFQALMPERAAGANTEYNALLVLKGELRKAINVYGPRHPAVEELQVQIAETESFIQERQSELGTVEESVPLRPDDVMAAYIRLLSNDLLALERRKSDIEKQIDEAGVRAKELVKYEMEDESYVRKMDRQEELFDSVVARLRDINMQQDSSSIIQEVISDPLLGEQVSPSGLVAVGLTLLSCLLLGGTAVLIAELTDKTFHTAEELEDVYGSPLLAHMPDFERDMEARKLVKKIAKTKPQASPTLLTLHAPTSQISEIYRTIRTQLLFSLRKGANLLAVTSPDQGDGKSTISTNLSLSIAKTGKSVLLVDCDMRRPNVHKIYGVDNKLGLVDIVSNRQGLLDVCHAGPVEGLTIVTTGELPDDPAELLSSEAFAKLLESWRAQYDFVILDCPPILRVSDPIIVAPLVDSILLVTRVVSQGLPKARQCFKALKSVETPIVGIVVNRAGSSAHGYSYAPYEHGYGQYGRETTQSGASV